MSADGLGSFACISDGLCRGMWVTGTEMLFAMISDPVLVKRSSSLT